MMRVHAKITAPRTGFHVLLAAIGFTTALGGDASSGPGGKSFWSL